MADTDLLPQRGLPVLALVDSAGIASNGTKTIAQFAASGIRCVCAVDGTGVSVGGKTVAQLASGGIRAFCPVDELGIATMVPPQTPCGGQAFAQWCCLVPRASP